MNINKLIMRKSLQGNKKLGMFVIFTLRANIEIIYKEFMYKCEYFLFQ